MDKIVVGYDGSEQAERALNRAVDLAERLDSKLEIVCVVSTSEAPTAGADAYAPVPHVTPAAPVGNAPGGGPFLLDDSYQGDLGDGFTADELAQRVLQKARQSIEKSSLEIDLVSEMGEPAERLLERSKGAQLLVVGRHHHRFLDHVFGGSVSDEVAKHGECDILIVS